MGKTDENNWEMDHQMLKASFEEAGQGHVFRFWEELDEAGRVALLKDLEAVDLAELKALLGTFLGEKGSQDETDFSALQPAPTIRHPREGGDEAEWREARQLGVEVIRAGRVAAFTVAGGQGTRLGYDGPKGTFPVTPVRKASLFQVFAEKIRFSMNRYGVEIPWMIMTSEVNHVETVEFFQENDYFGLPQEGVIFFRQGLMPAVDFDGKLLLRDRASLVKSPDGHGGSLRALVRSGSIDLLKEKGIDVISYFQVDNPLVTPIDPEFIGFHEREKSEMSSRMIPKAYPGEKIGHFCNYYGQLRVIEYSDLPEAIQEETLPDGSLRFSAGSIAIHLLDRDFVQRMGGTSEGSLPMHRAKKKIPHLDASGREIRPDEPNGIKFEMFVFDALPMAKRPVIVECLREDSFSPVKNAEGVDSPESCRNDQLRQFARWLKSVGQPISTDPTGLPEVLFEVAPTFAVDKVSFTESWERLNPKPAINEGTVLS